MPNLISNLQVLVHLDRTEIPPANIKHRWTKLAGPECSPPSNSTIADHVSAKMDETKRRVILMRAIDVAQGEGPIDDIMPLQKHYGQ
jgi:hypothetical protein